MLEKTTLPPPVHLGASMFWGCGPTVGYHILGIELRLSHLGQRTWTPFEIGQCR